MKIFQTVQELQDRVTAFVKTNNYNSKNQAPKDTRTRTEKITQYQHQIPIHFDKDTNTVTIYKHFKFKRHRYAWKDQQPKPQFNKLWRTTEYITPELRQAIHYPTKGIQMTLKKGITQYTLRFIRLAIALGQEVQLRAQTTQGWKGGTFQLNDTLKSPLDMVWYATTGKKEDSKLQSPFIVELPNTRNYEAIRMLKAFRTQHQNRIWKKVYQITEVLEQYLPEKDPEKEVYTSTYVDKIYDPIRHEVVELFPEGFTETEITDTAEYTAYGLNIRTATKEPTLDQYKFPQEYSGYLGIQDAETLNKVVSTIRQKHRENRKEDLVTQQFISKQCFEYYKEHNMLMPEHSLCTTCNKAISDNTQICVCGEENPRYQKTQEDLELEKRIAEEQSSEVTTYFLK